MANDSNCDFMNGHTIPKNTDEYAELSRLKERIKELEDINHAMAHNLRGAASNIKLLSELLLDQVPKDPENTPSSDTDFTVYEAVNYIHQSSTAMINTLGDMMEVVNKKLGEEAQADECDLQQAVENVTDQLNGVIRRNGVRIMMHLAIKKVKCAKTQLESIFYNMISNAIKYARPDVPLQLEICSYTVQGRNVLEFKDNGLGMDMSKIGSKLFKLNQVFHSNRDSKGVGLFITKKQIESRGGSIQVSSKVNEGTRFSIVL